MSTNQNKKLSQQIEEIVNSTNIAQTMNECLWVGDKNHKTMYVNPVFEKTSEYSLAECRKKDCVFFFDKEGKKTIKEHHRLRTRGLSSQYEATMVSKSGKKIPLLISGAPTREGGTIGIFTNLTKIKKLDRQKRIAQQIIRNSTEAIVVLSKARRIKMWNAGAQKMFGYKESEVLNKKITLIIPEEASDENKAILKEVEQKNYIKNFETVRKTKNGKIIHVNISVTKVADKNDHMIGYLVIYRDITEQKRINTELQKRFEAIQDAYKELGLQKRQNDYLFEINELATSSCTLENLAKLIVSAACMLTKCDASILRVHKPKSKSLKLISSLGTDRKWLNKNQIDYLNSIAEEAHKQGRPIIIQDLPRYPKHQGAKLAEAHGFKTLILIPLLLDKELLGTLSIYSTDPGKLRLIETDFLDRFGKQCSLAINTKLP